MAEPVPTIVLLTAAVLVLVMFYLLRSISRRRALMRFVVERGLLTAKAAPARAAAKKAKPKPKRKKGKKR